MIGLDTNVLVRFIMDDDALQSPKARRLIESLTADRPGFVSLITIIELYWVLSSAYSLSRAQVAQAFDALLRSKELMVEQAESVAKAARTFGAGNADFAGCLIASLCARAGCEATMTFDKGAAKAAGMTLIK